MDTIKKLLKFFGFGLMTFSVVGEEDSGGTGEENNEPENKGEATTDETDYDAEVQKRGAKNIIEENKRRAVELKSLREELESLKAQSQKPKTEPKTETKPDGKRTEYPPEIQEFYEESIKEGIKESYVKKQCDAMYRVAVNAAAFHRGELEKKFSSLSKYEKKLALQSLDETISALSDDPEYKGILPKYKKEIREVAEKEVEPEYWDNKAIIESIAGKVIIKKLKELGISSEETKDTVIKEKINETENNGSSKTMSGVSPDELKEYAETYGIDLSNPVAKKAAIKGVLAKKNAMKRIDN